MLRNYNYFKSKLLVDYPAMMLVVINDLMGRKQNYRLPNPMLCLDRTQLEYSYSHILTITKPNGATGGYVTLESGAKLALKELSVYELLAIINTLEQVALERIRDRGRANYKEQQ